MKKTSIILFFLLAAASSLFAQDRALGARVSTNVIEASYLSNLSSNVFFEADLGADSYEDVSGLKGELMMNFVITKPQLTKQGT